MSNLYIPDFFRVQGRRKCSLRRLSTPLMLPLPTGLSQTMTRRSSLATLLSQVGAVSLKFYLTFVVARLTAAVEDMDGHAQQLTLARQLEEDLAWFVDSLQQRPNISIWENLLQRVRILIDEAADDVNEENEDPDHPEDMKEAQVEDKAASTSDAQDHGWCNPSAAEILMRKRRSEDGSNQEGDVFENESQNDGDNKELDIKKIGVSSEQHDTKKLDGSIKGTDDGKGEADGKEIVGPALKKMRQALGYGDNKDTQGITVQESLGDPSLKVRSTTCPFIVLLMEISPGGRHQCHREGV